MKIALLQTTPIHDTQAALAAVDKAAGDASSQQGDVLITPEMMLGGYNVGVSNIAALAARADAMIDELQRIARRHHIALVCGLATPGPAQPFNTALAIDATGVELARYCKTHLYGAIDRAQFTAGPALSPVFTLGGWRTGLAICYDIEFPEVARDLADRGAELILVPTANMQDFNSISERIVPARAEENGVYIAYTNYIGEEGEFTYGGLSCVCGPDGNHLAKATALNPELLSAELDPAILKQTRHALDYLGDRRLDLYDSTHGNHDSQ